MTKQDAPTTTDADSQCRAEFEAWYASECGLGLDFTEFRRDAEVPDDYHHWETQAAWEAWQAARASSAAAQWLPIADAPKDGSTVLLGHPAWPQSCEGGWKKRCKPYVHDFNDPRAHLPYCEYWGYESHNVLPLRPQPTHYQPLPAPPAKPDDTGEAP